MENKVEPTGLSGSDKREEEEAFFRGRVSKESGREDVMREDDLAGSGECSFAFRLLPKMVISGDEVSVFELPSFMGVPVLGNVHFFLIMVQGWQTVPLSVEG